jgi:hypothetical protein
MLSSSNWNLVHITTSSPILAIDCLLVISLDNMPPPDCICVAGCASNFLQLTPPPHAVQILVIHLHGGKRFLLLVLPLVFRLPLI